MTDPPDDRAGGMSKAAKLRLGAVGLVFAIGAVFALVPDGETRRARELCEAIPGGNLLTANVLIGAALEEHPDIFSAMSNECPEVVDLLIDRIDQLTDATGSSRSVTSGPTSAELIGAQHFETERCNQDGHAGSVRNGASVTVDLTIETQFLRNGTLVDTGFDYISGLRTNQTAEWTTRYFGSGLINECRSEISSARARRETPVWA